jgi:hypothetical protein
MKSYRNAIAALVLAFVFSTNALADEGVMHTDRTPPPPPPTNGIIWMESAAPTSEDESLTEITLTLLQTLLPLL